MGDSATINRRDFTLKSALTVLAGTTITITGCKGSDNPTAPTGPTGAGGDVGAVIGTNHVGRQHSAEIARAQLTAGNAISLDIQGSSDHPHTVELTMNDVQQIDSGNQVNRESSSDASPIDGNHSHTATFN